MPTQSEQLFPLLWSNDVEAVSRWAQDTLGLSLAWQAPGEHGGLDHVELTWGTGRVSVNRQAPEYQNMGPSGVAMQVDSKAHVDAVYALVKQTGTEIVRDLENSPIAYSFTVLDPDQNQWWVHFETGMLDELRNNTQA